MRTVRLDGFSEETIVLHFGGLAGSIDAYTLANALIGFADTAYAINATIDPGQDIEIVIEETGPGSFRAVIRRLKKSYGGTLSAIAGTVFWGVVANVVYDATLKPADPKTEITINTTEVIIKRGGDTIIVPRTVHDFPRTRRRTLPSRRASRRRSKVWRRTLMSPSSVSPGAFRTPARSSPFPGRTSHWWSPLSLTSMSSPQSGPERNALAL
jgi:hypothetical protein